MYVHCSKILDAYQYMYKARNRCDSITCQSLKVITETLAYVCSAGYHKHKLYDNFP